MGLKIERLFLLNICTPGYYRANLEKSMYIYLPYLTIPKAISKAINTMNRAETFNHKKKLLPKLPKFMFPYTILSELL